MTQVIASVSLQPSQVLKMQFKPVMQLDCNPCCAGLWYASCDGCFEGSRKHEAQVSPS